MDGTVSPNTNIPRNKLMQKSALSPTTADSIPAPRPHPHEQPPSCACVLAASPHHTTPHHTPPTPSLRPLPNLNHQRSPIPKRPQSQNPSRLSTPPIPNPNTHQNPASTSRIFAPRSHSPPKTPIPSPSRKRSRKRAPTQQHWGESQRRQRAEAGRGGWD